MGKGPLSGVKVVEMAGIGPSAFCGMLLSDMGAEVIRVDRKGAAREPLQSPSDPMTRGRRSIALDLKTDEGVEVCLKLISQADMLQEGFRPGVMERLGLGPDICLASNRRLVYGRMTGWGQDGPLAQAAGHDINYIALTGALHAIGPKSGKPVPPLALVGDLGGGGLYLALGMVSALFAAQRSGEGQVVDAAIVDGVTSMMAVCFGMLASGSFPAERGSGLVDGGAPFYDTYETADGQYISIAAMEPKFYVLLRAKLGLIDPLWDRQLDRAAWPVQKAVLADIFARKSRDEWSELLQGTDVCFAPVLALSEMAAHPHNLARKVTVEVDGMLQPNVAPRFSHTPSAIQGGACEAGRDTIDILTELGYSAKEISHLSSIGVT